MKFIFVAVLVLICSTDLAAIDKKEALEMMSNGNVELTEENYSEAIDLFEPLIEDFQSVQLFHNLSLAYFYKGDLGRAILFMERASNLKPLDRNVQRNLKLLKENVDSEITRVPPFFLKSWMSSVSSLGGITAWIILHLVSLFGGTYLLYQYLIRKVDFGLHFYYMRGLIIACFVLSLIFASFAFNRYQGIYNDPSAVVLVNQVPLRMGAESNSLEVMKVNQGVLAKIEDEIGDFYKVKLEDYTEGWVLKSSVERI